MFFLIGLLKFIIILGVNIGFGLLLSSLIYSFFFCSRTKYFFGYKIPFTPGLLYRKKKWLINKLNKLVNDYIRYASDENLQNNYLAVFERKMQKNIHESLKEFFKGKMLPAFMKNKLVSWLQSLSQLIVRKITRELIPYIIFTADISGKIDLLEDKLNIDMLKTYFNEYVYKYILYFIYIFFGLIGICNSVLYLILNIF